jgi:hypothetical protein
MRKLKKLKLSKAEKVSGEIKTTTKKRKDTSGNLGHYLYKAKLPSGGKIGAVKVKKSSMRKLGNKAQKGVHSVTV